MKKTMMLILILSWNMESFGYVRSLTTLDYTKSIQPKMINNTTKPNPILYISRMAFSQQFPVKRNSFNRSQLQILYHL